jgi:hypothetical protein
MLNDNLYNVFEKRGKTYTKILVSYIIDDIENKYNKMIIAIEAGQDVFSENCEQWIYVKESLEFHCKVAKNRLKLLYRYKSYLFDDSLEEKLNISIDDRNKIFYMLNLCKNQFS